MARDETENYEAGFYDTKERFNSYHEQITLIHSVKAKTVLNIGCGSKFLQKYFSGSGIKVFEADIDHDLKPDILIDISKKYSPKKTYDAVTAFQILEHLPFDSLDIPLENIAALTKKYAIISVPYRAVNFSFSFDFPFFKPKFRFDFERFFETKHSHKTHEWELGLKGTGKKIFQSKLEKFFSIKKQFVLNGNRYHYFYLLEKK